eukprot:TCONS_00025423-protein
MSWDGYIDNLLGHCVGQCDTACIIGKDGSKWTTDGHASALKITAQEAATVGKAFTSGDMTPFQASGIVIAGVKYQFLRGDDILALGKKKDNGAVTLQCSKTAVVIGHTKEGGTQGNTNKGVAVIAEYLESLGM